MKIVGSVAKVNPPSNCYYSVMTVMEKLLLRDVICLYCKLRREKEKKMCLINESNFSKHIRKASSLKS